MTLRIFNGSNAIVLSFRGAQITCCGVPVFVSPYVYQSQACLSSPSDGTGGIVRVLGSAAKIPRLVRVLRGTWMMDVTTSNTILPRSDCLLARMNLHMLCVSAYFAQQSLWGKHA